MQLWTVLLATVKKANAIATKANVNVTNANAILVIVALVTAMPVARMHATVKKESVIVIRIRASSHVTVKRASAIVINSNYLS